MCVYTGLLFPEPHAEDTYITSGMFVAYVDHQTNASLVCNHYAYFHNKFECEDEDVNLKNLFNKLYFLKAVVFT